MTIPQGAIALAAMDPDDFTEVVKSAIPRSAPAAMWDALTDPAVIGRTRECLAAFRTDVQQQLSLANSEADEARAEAIASGGDEEGRRAFWAEKNAQAEWRRRAKGFMRLVDQRVALVKARTGGRPEPASPTKRARAHNSGALEKLARAVLLHRDRVLSGEGSEDDDEVLWDCLSTVTAVAGGDEMPLEKWLRLIDEREADE